MRRFTYFNSKPTNPLFVGSYQTHQELAEKNSAVVSHALSWPVFNKQCSLGEIPDLVLCGAAQIIDAGPAEFLSTINSIIKTHSPNKEVKFAVASSDELHFDDIEKLKTAGFSGIHPISSYYGTEVAANGIGRFLNGQNYWPEFVINHYKKINSIPTVVVFNSSIEIQNQLTLSACRFFAKQRESNFKVEIASTWDELSALMRTNPSTLLFHTDLIEDSAKEFVESLESFVKFTHPKRRINMAAIITKQTSISLVNELRQTKVSGIITGFNQWGEDETLPSIMNAINAVPHWPKHILKQLSGQSLKCKKHAVDLSYRQQQILNIIQTSGTTNQQIADKLKIKEGTVKLHVGILLKKYGVRNRTQLANL